MPYVSCACCSAETTRVRDRPSLLPEEASPSEAGCPQGADLTAHAHGEGDTARRARVARHLLACAPCRSRHDADARLLLELRALGAARSLPPPPLVAQRTRRWLAFVPPVAAAVLVGVALLAPGSPEPRAPEARTVASASQAPHPARPTATRSAGKERLAQLLGSQAEDGHWEAEDGPLGADDACATGVVLLALLHEGALGAGSESLDLAVRLGSRWLAERLADPDPALHALAAAPRAVLLAALARTLGTNKDAALAPSSAALLEDLTTRLAQGQVDSAALPWVDYALAAAEEAELPGARAARRELLTRVPSAVLARQARPPSPALLTSAVPVDCTPLRSAIEVLRDEPPVRTLALGPACRPVGLALQR